MPRKTRKKINPPLTQPPLKFDQKLVLNQWILSLFEVKNFEQLTIGMKEPEREGFDEDNISRFFYVLSSRLFERKELTSDILLAYDQNIVRHWKTITERRNMEGQILNLKYFQYLSLLFSEMYLDRYFQDSEKLLLDLNKHVEQFNSYKADRDKIDTYVTKDLNKLAYWSATGSGKTLLMHVNILQYQHYLKAHNRERSMNRIILLTPNEGLSNQHLEEFRISGMDAELFSKDGRGLYFGRSVEIIDIHKLREESGEKTVAIEAFEGDNLVLVDEGHRGASGVDWKSRRDQLCENGFSFEYSATFGQAVRAASGDRGKKLEQEYVKCTLFDYSYKYFYGDGYGKEYRILNLKDDSEEVKRQRYLTACLLAFYQQQKLFEDKKDPLRKFLIEKPLWVFVGGSVNAVRTENKKKVSDVIDILLYLASFVENQKETIDHIKKLLTGKTDLLDEHGNDIFIRSFAYLNNQELTADEVYEDILRVIFNASSRAKLHVENLKGSEGEIALRLGDNEPFGVINVGDVSALCKLCEGHDELVVADMEFSGSLFRTINDKESSINILIGSKKFTEGWSSWRVSTMGLMNIGRGEGPQIIQLFGRGVRLKGIDFCLKRSRRVLQNTAPAHIELVETLNIFGIRADYMSQFNEYLKEEGLPTDDEKRKIVLPIKENVPKGDKLKVPGLKDGLDFKRNGPKPILDPQSSYLRKYPIVLNWYPKIQVKQSKGASTSTIKAQLNLGKFDSRHVAFMDIDAIYTELQQFKNEKSWFNLNFPLERMVELLSNDGWYHLYIPEDQLQPDNFKKVAQWQEIAIALMKKYTERFYKHQKAIWDNEHLEYQEISADEFKDREYSFEVQLQEQDIIDELLEIKEAIEEGKLDEIEAKRSNGLYQEIGPIIFDCHLYHPLIYLKNNRIRVTPVELKESEKEFVLDLMKYYKNNSEVFKDMKLYLLRNESKGKGIGFFQDGGFYPDFILWLIKGNKQFIAFIDPHGLRFAEGRNDRKIQFSKTIKDVEIKLPDPNIILNSFIITPTLHSEIQWFGQDNPMTKKEFNNCNVLFQKDDKDKYIEQLIEKVQ